MLPTQVYQKQLSVKVAESSSDRIEMSRLLAAAVVNYQFRDLLLNNPEMALKSGYLGETFMLSEEERTLILSIRAKTLPEFARQITRLAN